MASVVGSGSSKMAPSVSAEEKGSRNKRKLEAEPPPLGEPNKVIPSDECSSQDHCDGSKLELGLSEVRPSQPKEELEADEFHDAEWSYFTQNQLRELVLSNLDAIFKSAINKIVASGYTEDVATKSVLRIGIWYGCNDTVSNIADNALAFLRNRKEVGPSQEQYYFEDLVQLEKYVLYELICVLRELRPSISFADAMWCLLICDMNVAQASAIYDDPLSCNSIQTEPKGPELSLPSPSKLIPSSRKSFVGGNSGLDDSKNSQILDNSRCDCFNKSSSTAVTSQSSLGEEKCGGVRIRKDHSNSTKRDSIIQQKSFHVEKSYQTYGSKGSSRGGKMTGLSGIILDKKLKSTINLKSASLNISNVVSQSTDTSSLVHGANAISATDTDLSLPLSSKGKSNSKTPICCKNEATKTSCVAIPYDKSPGQWIPRDDKDELILKLVSRIQGLQKHLQTWTDWTNEKVMQVTRRLSKDKAELKTLRQEKEEVERLKKEKQFIEENTMKKLSEIENAVSKASGQVKEANAAVWRLEVENAVLRKEMEAAKLRAAESATNCQEALRREKNTDMKFQSREKQKSLLKEELMTEKHKLAQLKQQVKQAKGKKEQAEARLKQVVKAKEELLQQASCIRKEKERIDEATKAKEDMMKMKAEENVHRYRDKIQKLEKEHAQLRHKTDSSKIAALRRGIDGSYSAPEDSSACISELVTDLKDLSLRGGVKREKECVMCLSEEMSVVFLPCAHQVVCTTCNEIHEKQGMQECPSCRSPIQKRILARFAHT